MLLFVVRESSWKDSLKLVVQAQELVKSTLNFVQEVLGEEDEIPEAAELRKQRLLIEGHHKEVEQLLTQEDGTVAALKLALQMVEMLLFLSVKSELGGQCATSAYLTGSRQQSVMSRIGEILWAVKDALELARDLQDLWIFSIPFHFPHYPLPCAVLQFPW